VKYVGGKIINTRLVKRKKKLRFELAKSD